MPSSYGNGTSYDRPFVAEQVVGPRHLHDLVVLLEQESVPLIGARLVRRGRGDAEVLADDVLPAGLVAARETDEQASLEHMVGDRDRLGEPHRVVGRHDETELAVPEALRERPEEHVEQQRVGRDLEPLGMPVVLDVSNAPVAELVGRLAALDQVLQHVLVRTDVASDGAQGLHLPPVSQGRIDLQDYVGHCRVLLS